MIFQCKNCGGNTVYAPEKGGMYCPHCESLDSEECIGGSSLVQCINCGAPLAITDFTSACKCEHCGSYLILNERVEGGYEPHLILPFSVGRQAAAAALEQEFSRRFFAPSDFMSTKSLEKMEGTYVPFWLYDYDADYDFAGEGIRVRTWIKGDTEYTETSYFEVIRRLDVDFDKIPVDASFAMDDRIMDRMEPYDYSGFTAYAPKYMSGFLGEVYNQEAPELESRAREKAREASEQLLQGSLTGYTMVRPFHKNLDLREKGVHYALMPVWQYLYRYRDKTYLYHVNGQTGKVIGTTPVSRAKVFGCGAAVFVLAAVLVLLCTGYWGIAGTAGQEAVSGAVPCLIGFIAAVIVICVSWLMKERGRTTTAATYVAGRQPVFRVSQDRFLRKTVTSRKMQTDSSGGRGIGHSSR